MREITYRAAIKEALREEMLRDERVFLIGEDIGGKYGGTFKVTEGLSEEFGNDRVRNTPISELAIVGAAIGSAMTGMRPVVELMLCDLTALAMDQICNVAAKIRYMSGGQFKVPLVIRAPLGGGVSMGAVHSQCLEAFFMHIPGLKVVLPSTPYDAKGLLKSAIRDESPVMYLEHKAIYSMKGSVPENEYLIPLGEAEIKKPGHDVTVIATSNMVNKVINVAERLRNIVDIEVLDPRTLSPLDKNKIINSVKKTHKAIIVTEDCTTAGVGAEIAAIIAENAFDYLDAPIKRVGEPDTPIPFSPSMENYVIPNEDIITSAVKDIADK